MTNEKVTVATKCEECGAPADEGFHFGGGIHYFCEKHEDVVFTKVTGNSSKPANSGGKK